MVRQMRKLRRLLKKNNFMFREEQVSYTEIIYWDRFKVHLFNNENDKIRTISIVNGFGSYGGYDINNPKNKGLIEVLIKDKDEEYGNLTAKEVIKILKKERGF